MRFNPDDYVDVQARILRFWGEYPDGAIQTGFRVARDPYELGPFAIGADSYSQDDFFPTLGTAPNVARPGKRLQIKEQLAGLRRL